MEEQRRQILIAAGVEMAARGIRAVTMDEIAAKVGKSKRTIYTYFKDKDEIVRAIFSEHFACPHAGIGGEEQTVIERLLAIMRAEARRSVQVCPQFFEDLIKYYPDLFADLSAHRRRQAREELGPLLSQGVESGEIQANLDLEVIADLVTELPLLLLSSERITHLGYSTDRLRAAAQQLLFTGLLTEAGQSKLNELRDKNWQLQDEKIVK